MAPPVNAQYPISSAESAPVRVKSPPANQESLVIYAIVATINGARQNFR